MARNRSHFLWVIALCLGFQLLNVGFAKAQSSAFDNNSTLANSPSAAGLQQFARFSTTDGWVLLNQHLYWTGDAGARWSNITPTNIDSIETVFFRDTANAWAVVTSKGVTTLAITQNNGKSWQLQPLSLFASSDPHGIASAFYLQFIDPKTGWLVVKQATSSNFSSGTLFKTLDGGATWQKLPLPIGDEVFFLTDQIGWVAGGATGAAFYRTLDGGASWQPQAIGSGTIRSIQNPVFANPLQGVVTVGTGTDESGAVEVYTTNNAGQDWTLSQRIPVGQGIFPRVKIPTALLSNNTAIIAPPGSPLLALRGETMQAASANPLTDVSDIRFAPDGSGFAKTMTGQCIAATCTAEARLLSTTNGGQSWQSVILPETISPSSQSRIEGSTIAGGQGFDMCEITGTSQMQTWRNNGPYSSVNLYIGGNMRTCANSNISSSFVLQLAQQGWKFIPTWVGPQGGGNTCCGSIINNDPTTAYNQGVSEANAASDVAGNLGFGATVIYYDLENYDTTNSTYRNAVKSFISGWDAQIRARGHKAGVYGASCGSSPVDFTSIANVPDVVWLANWYYTPPNGSYDSSATVWGVACLGDGWWSNHQRIRQYAGGHNETWGGLTLNIDSNVIDGVVATRISPPGAPTITTPAQGSTIYGLNFNVVLQPGTLNETGFADFHFDISSDSSFSNVVFHVQSQTSTTIAANVPAPGNYWIRAQQGDGCCNNSAYSAVVAFTVSTVTATPTNTPTRTNTPTNTNTPTRTNTPTNTFTATNTYTPSKTNTSTNTPTATNTPVACGTETINGLNYGSPASATANCKIRIFPFTVSSSGPQLLDITSDYSSNWVYTLALKNSGGSVVATAQSSTVGARGVVQANLNAGNYTLEVTPITAWQRDYTVNLYTGYATVLFDSGSAWNNAQLYYSDVNYARLWGWATASDTWRVSVSRLDGNLEMSVCLKREDNSQLACSNTTNGYLDLVVTGDTFGSPTSYSYRQVIFMPLNGSKGSFKRLRQE